MKFIVYLSLFLSAVLCKAEDFDYTLVGGNYTYIDFDVSRENNWPIFFTAITKNDSIKVDLSDFDKFVESVLQSCDYVGSLMDAYYAFYNLFGRSQRTYDMCRFTLNDFYIKFEELERKTKLDLQTGEKVYVRYFDVSGIFMRVDKTVFRFAADSNGLPKKNWIMNEIYFPITGLDFRKGTLYFIKKETDEENE